MRRPIHAAPVIRPGIVMMVFMPSCMMSVRNHGWPLQVFVAGSTGRTGARVVRCAGARVFMPAQVVVCVMLTYVWAVVMTVRRAGRWHGCGAIRNCISKQRGTLRSGGGGGSSSGGDGSSSSTSTSSTGSSSSK